MGSQNLNTTLTALPATTTPITTKQAGTLASNMEQLKNLNNRELWALGIVSKIRTLKYKSGFNYVSNHAQLQQDAAAFMGGFSVVCNPHRESSLLMAMQTSIDWSSAKANDSTTPSTINGLMIEAAELPSVPETTLEFIYFFLRYQIA